MSLCYDFDKWTILTLGLVAISLSVGLVLQNVHGQEWNTTQQNIGPLENFTRTAQNGTKYTCQEGSNGKVLGCSPIGNNTNAVLMKPNAQSDFYLEAKVNLYNTSTKSIFQPYGGELKITKFQIQGNSGSYIDMCPSLQCKIDYKDYANFSPPNIPEDTLISSNPDFRLQDNITHADLGPKKKELVEQYGVDIYCDVFDIVEKNWQELYYCHDDGPIYNNIHNKFDRRSWGSNFTGIYDAKNNMLKISGNFTGHTQRY